MHPLDGLLVSYASRCLHSFVSTTDSGWVPLLRVIDTRGCWLCPLELSACSVVFPDVWLWADEEWKPISLHWIHIGGLFFSSRAAACPLLCVLGYLFVYSGRKPPHHLCDLGHPFPAHSHVLLPGQPLLPGNVLHQQCGAADAGAPPGEVQDHKCGMLCSADVRIHHLGTDRMLSASSHGLWSLCGYLLPTPLHSADGPFCPLEVGWGVLDDRNSGGVSTDHVDLHSAFLWSRKHSALFLWHHARGETGMCGYLPEWNRAVYCFPDLHHESLSLHSVFLCAYSSDHLENAFSSWQAQSLLHLFISHFSRFSFLWHCLVHLPPTQEFTHPRDWQGYCSHVHCGHPCSESCYLHFEEQGSERSFSEGNTEEVS